MNKAEFEEYYKKLYKFDIEYFKHYLVASISHKDTYHSDFLGNEYGNLHQTYFSLAMVIGNNND